jgi:hypothetical protein
MDHLDHLKDLAGKLPLERATTALRMALDEHAECMKFDEEIAVSQKLPAELDRRLNHGYELAMARARTISTAIGGAVAHLPIRALPPEYQQFHSDYLTTLAQEDIERAFGTWDDGPDHAR